MKKRYFTVVALVAAVCGGLAYRLSLPSTPAVSPPAATPQNAPASAPAPLLVRGLAEPVSLPVSVTGKPRKAAAGMPATLAEALADHGHSFDARLRTVNILGSGLGAEDVTQALAYLRDPAPADGLSASQRAAFKNDLVNALRTQTTPPAGLTATLLAVAGDPQAGPVLRDYALQHLSEWRARAAADELPAIDAALWRAAGSAEPLAGTALLALCRQAEGEGSDPAGRARVTARAQALAADAHNPLAARVTALSVAGRLDPAATLALATRIASTETSVSLLAAAVPILRAHRADPAAQTALQTLSTQAAIPVRRLALAALR